MHVDFTTVAYLLSVSTLVVNWEPELIHTFQYLILKLCWYKAVKSYCIKMFSRREEQEKGKVEGNSCTLVRHSASASPAGEVALRSPESKRDVYL